MKNINFSFFLQRSGVALWLALFCLGYPMQGVAQAAAPASTKAVPSDWWVHVTNDRPAQVQQMLARGVDPNALSPQGQPALILAVRTNAWKVFDQLLQSRRVDLNVQNAMNETPLMYVALVGDVNRAKVLIRKGAQVNRLGWTPLQYAASTGQEDMIKLLLAQGAIVNAPGPNGETAIMMAALAGNEPAVRRLLHAGADPSARDLSGNDAAAWARRRGHMPLAAKLDDLIRRVQAQRQQQAAAGDSGTASPAEQGVTTHPVLDIPVTESPAVPEQAPVTMPAPQSAPTAQEAPAPQHSATGSAPQSASDSSVNTAPAGRSYFNLDRFNTPNAD